MIIPQAFCAQKAVDLPKHLEYIFPNVPFLVLDSSHAQLHELHSVDLFVAAEPLSGQILHG